MADLLTLRNVSKTFHLERRAALQVLKDIDFSVRTDDVIALVGPSGSGKSTCLRIASGLIEPTKGEVLVQGERLTGVNSKAAMVFQSFGLFPWHTAYDNIAMALEPLDLRPSTLKSRVRKAIDLVGLEGYEEAYPRELSGGMKQRVGLARALVMERPLLFLDEPFSALGMLTAEALMTEVQSILMRKETATSGAILVTHNVAEAVFLANRILIMGMNPGRIRQEVANPLPFPRDERSGGFKEMVTSLQAQVTEVLMPDFPPAEGDRKRVGPSAPVRHAPAFETLPNVHVTEMIGLLEAIADEGGQSNIFDIARRTGKEFGKTLFLVKAAELFEFVDTPRQHIILTGLGRRFVAGDVNQRKRMLHELFKALQIVQMTTEMLRIHGELKMPIDNLRICVQEWLPNEHPEEVIAAIIEWGRFAEVFGYNDDAKELYLDVGQEAS